MKTKVKDTVDLFLDKETLEFAIKIAWQGEFMCKQTKEGRAKAHAYSDVRSTLQHYLQRLEPEVTA